MYAAGHDRRCFTRCTWLSEGAAVLRSLALSKVRTFYAAYIAAGAITLVLWAIAPGIVIGVFLLIAAFHFGKEDVPHQSAEDSSGRWWLLLLKGAVVVSAPLWFQPEKTLAIFESLSMTLTENVQVAAGQIYFLGAVATLVLCAAKPWSTRLTLVFDYASVSLLNWALDPLVAFTVYFCFLHSLRHSLEVIGELDRQFLVGLKRFVRKAWPLTLVTAACFGFALVTLLETHTMTV